MIVLAPGFDDNQVYTQNNLKAVVELEQGLATAKDIGGQFFSKQKATSLFAKLDQKLLREQARQGSNLNAI